MKLVIIGNGFDLASGLPTSYADFFAYRQRVVGGITEDFLALQDKVIPSNIYGKLSKVGVTSMATNSSPSEGIKQALDIEKDQVVSILVQELEAFDNELTVWDVFFRLQKEQNTADRNSSWSNIENQIEEFIMGDIPEKGASLPVCISRLSITPSTLLDLKPLKYGHDYPESTYFDNVLSEVSKEAMLSFLLSALIKQRYCHVTSSIPEMLLSELNEFEDSFRGYIGQIMDTVISKNPNSTGQKTYRDNLFRIVSPDPKESFFVLNFNYTHIATIASQDGETSTPVDELPMQRGGGFHKVTEVNVHGRYDQVAIFGVDQSRFHANEEKYIFTKTFRKVSEQDKLSPLPLPAKGDVKEIVFYGHSLSDADYSYFQSIFDYYDIYHSSVILTFKYSLYGDSSRHGSLKTEHFRRVTKLIRAYGASMSNQSHGNNLVHKLLLENRLRVMQTHLLPIDASDFRKTHLGKE